MVYCSAEFRNLGNAFNADFVQEKSKGLITKKLSETLKILAEEDEEDCPIEFEKMKNSTNIVMNEIKNDVLEIDTMMSNINTNIPNALSTANIRDSEFLEREIKSVLLSSKRVLGTLEKDIKIGAAPRMYEVYATLLGAITNQHKELRNLNESVAKFIIENKKQNLEEVKEDHKMMLSSNDVLDMFINAKNDSNMGAIDADFDVMDTD